MNTNHDLFGRATLALFAGAALVAAACSSSKGSGETSHATTPPTNEDAGQQSSSSADAGEDAGDASEDSASPPPQAYLRIAHLSPDLPAVDVCVAPHGTMAFQGPLVGELASSLAGDAGPDAASAAGLAYAQVSAYLPLTAGEQYDVRIVAAGSTSCSAPLALVRPFVLDGGSEEAGTQDAAASDGASDATMNDASSEATPDAESPLDSGADASGSVGDVTNLPTLAFNTHSTLLLAGDLSPTGSDAPLTVTALGDDAVLAGGAAVLRAINAVPSAPTLDFGLESLSEWLPVFVNVAFAKASAVTSSGDGTVDSNGYLAITPLAAGQRMSARAPADASADLAATASVEIDLGSIVTVLAIGGKTADATNPPALLICTDNQPSGGLLSDCSVAAP